MKRIVSAGLMSLLLPAGIAWAQPSTQPPATPPATSDDDDDDQPAVDRPLARALAFERRDIVEELLKSPGSLSTASATELAEDLAIPKAHAERLIEAARAGTLPEDLKALTELGVPAGKTVPGDPTTVKLEELKSAGWSEKEAKEFLRFRRSAQRAHRHFRELKAIEEARTRGSELFRDNLRVAARGNMGERIRAVSEILGVRAVELSPEHANANREAAAASSEVGGGRNDPLASYRRADGTLDMAKFSKSQVFGGAAGMAHFAFALFLKEMAITLKTGDRTRLEQFVDGLLDTDFFVNYGLFAAGAKAADTAYGAYVRRITRKRFLSGVFRSNLVLAAGLAVPMVASGKFDLDTYIVDVAALGLSATAVKVAVEGMKGAYRLVRGGRTAINLGRLASPIGWVATAGETAIVLLIGDELAKRMDKWMDERELRGRVKSAGDRLQELVGAYRRGEHVDPAEMARAVEALEAGYDDMRRHKAAPMEATLVAFHGELEKAAKDALATDTATSALERRLAENPLVREHVERTGFTERLSERREAAREETLRTASDEFEHNWNEALEESYVGDTTAEDPAPRPESRLGLYDEETDALLRALDATTNPEARDLIIKALERVRLKRAMDRAVYRTGGSSADASPAPAGANTPGLSGSVDRQ